jgi:hypothetical protein
MSKNPVFAILWLLLLFFVAWPVAAFCAGIWIFLQVRLVSHSKKKKSIDDTNRSFLSFPQILTPTLALYQFFTIELN